MTGFLLQDPPNCYVITIVLQNLQSCEFNQFIQKYNHEKNTISGENDTKGNFNLFSVTIRVQSTNLNKIFV